MALSHLGDVATVASISPPESSAQAQHCAIFYPMARDALLEMHDWGFATTRIRAALKKRNYHGWHFVYAAPADMLRIVSVKPETLCRDESIQSVPYRTERGDDGGRMILCDYEDVVVKYTTLITDPNRFPPLFVSALSWSLASMLAGPILKGDTGAAMAKHCLTMMQMYLAQAATSDAQQNQHEEKHIAGWLKARA